MRLTCWQVGRVGAAAVEEIIRRERQKEKAVKPIHELREDGQWEVWPSLSRCAATGVTSIGSYHSDHERSRNDKDDKTGNHRCYDSPADPRLALPCRQAMRGRIVLPGEIVQMKCVGKRIDIEHCDFLHLV